MTDPLWQGGAVWKAVLGDRSETQVLELLDGLCAARLGAGIDSTLFGETSVGIVFGLLLTDGRKVVAKAHQPRDGLDFLDAVQGVQMQLHDAGFPCPRPLAEPAAFVSGNVSFEELVDEGCVEDGRTPAIRHALAEALASHLDFARTISVPRSARAGLEGLEQPRPVADRGP